MQQNFIELGYTKKTFGIKGVIEVYLDVDNPKDYKNIKELFIQMDKEVLALEVENITFRNNKPYIKFKDYDSIDDSKNIAKKTLLFPESQLPQLSENQYYYHELIDMQVFEKENKKPIGEVKRIYTDYATDRHFLELNPHGTLIPIIDHFILDVHKAEKKIIVALPEGFLDVFKSQKEKV